jgi:hypothetical protein
LTCLVATSGLPSGTYLMQRGKLASAFPRTPWYAIKLLDNRDLGKYTTRVFLLPNKYFYTPKTQPIGRVGQLDGGPCLPSPCVLTGVDYPLDGGFLNLHG